MIKKIHDISKEAETHSDIIESIWDESNKYEIEDNMYYSDERVPIEYYFYYHACLSSIASPNIITLPNGEVNVVMHIERTLYSRRMDLRREDRDFKERSTKCFEYICDERDFELLNKDIEGFFENKMNEKEENNNG